jgi:predicted RNA binding protein YcfA (HicA-like mRNA interferase family)
MKWPNATNFSKRRAERRTISSLMNCANWLSANGFEFQRQSGSHHIYKHPDYPRILTFPECAVTVKPVYVKNLLDAIEELGGSDVE